MNQTQKKIAEIIHSRSNYFIGGQPTVSNSFIKELADMFEEEEIEEHETKKSIYFNRKEFLKACGCEE